MNYNAIKLTAPIKDYLWGGTRLKTDFGKVTDKEKAAESWELSTHPDGESIVSGGEFDGMTLSQYIKANGGDECIGTRAAEFDFFPILIKLIDAKDNLSIQVHPNDEYAMRVEGEYGKTEMWYIVDCEDDAYLYYGVNRDITKLEFEERIKNNTLLEILNKVPVKKAMYFSFRQVLFMRYAQVYLFAKYSKIQTLPIVSMTMTDAVLTENHVSYT